LKCDCPLVKICHFSFTNLMIQSAWAGIYMLKSSMHSLLIYSWKYSIQGLLVRYSIQDLLVSMPDFLSFFQECSSIGHRCTSGSAPVSGAGHVMSWQTLCCWRDFIVWKCKTLIYDPKIHVVNCYVYNGKNGNCIVFGSGHLWSCDSALTKSNFRSSPAGRLANWTCCYCTLYVLVVPQ